MIYVCNHCSREMSELRTEGDEVNNDLICASCAHTLDEVLRKAREAHYALLNHWRRLL